jgi:4-aminobutyrate aminotransferase-like enzyme
LGHCHPELVAAITDQAARLSFVTGGESRLRHEFEERICEFVYQSFSHHIQETHPFDSLKAWISTTGARAIEIAWRIAFQRKPGGLVTFDLGYHGRSIATSYASDTAQQDCLMAGPSHEVRFPIPFPRVEAGTNKPLQEACNESIDAFQKLLQTHPGRLSALLIEPAIGSRGYYFAPANYFQRLATLGREHGLIIISDEIQMGLGRLGATIASHSQSWRPDLLVFGKALGGGMLPISCVIGSSEITDQLRSGYESETFAGSPLACRIAIETLRILSSTRVVEESRLLHEDLRLELASALPKGSVAGLGSATVIDLANAVMNLPTRVKQPASSGATGMGTMAAYRIAGQLRENGILVHVTGSLRDRIAIIPPLNIGPAEMSRVIAECVNAWQSFAQGE